MECRASVKEDLNQDKILGYAMTERGLTAVFEKHGNWYVAYIEEIPGVNTQGRTLQEAKENLKDALKAVLEARREIAEKEIRSKDVIKEKIPFPT